MQKVNRKRKYQHLLDQSCTSANTAGRKVPKLSSDAERVAFLFEQCRQLTSLLPAVKPTRAVRERI